MKTEPNTSLAHAPSAAPLPPSPHAPSPKNSQGATTRGPLKSVGPLRFQSLIVMQASCRRPASGGPALVHYRASKRAGKLPAPQQTVDFDSKTKGRHLPPKNVATFEKSGTLSFLTQYRTSSDRLHAKCSISPAFGFP